MDQVCSTTAATGLALNGKGRFHRRSRHGREWCAIGLLASDMARCPGNCSRHPLAGKQGQPVASPSPKPRSLEEVGGDCHHGHLDLQETCTWAWAT